MHATTTPGTTTPGTTTPGTTTPGTTTPGTTTPGTTTPEGATPGGANWLRSTNVAPFARPLRSIRLTGCCLAALCLLAAQPAFLPSMARGQIQVSYASIYRHAPTMRSATSSSLKPTSSRLSFRRSALAPRALALALAQKGGQTYTISDSTTTGTEAPGTTQEPRALPADGPREEALENSASSRRYQSPVSLESVRQSLSKLAEAIDGPLPQQAQGAASSPDSHPLPPSVSPQLSLPTTPASSPRVDLKLRIPSSLGPGRFGTTQLPPLSNVDTTDRTGPLSKAFSSFFDGATLPEQDGTIGSPNSVLLIVVENAASAVTAPATLPGNADEQSSRHSARLTAVVNSNQSETGADPPSTFSTLNSDKAIATKKVKLPSSIIFRRSSGGRLERHRYSLPRPPKSKARQPRAIPVPVVRQELPQAETQITSLQQATVTSHTPPVSTAPQTFNFRDELPISTTITPERLSTFVNVRTSSVTERRSVAEAEHSGASTEVQPPATADSPSDIGPLLRPRVDESPLTAADEHVAEEVAPRPDDDLDRPVETLGTNIKAPAGEFPKDVAAARFAAAGEMPAKMGAHRGDAEVLVFWDAPAIAHRPLYFEEVNLERYGYRVPLIQPVLSGAHFFGRLPALPYLMVSEKHRQQRYTLGHYRPGSMAPYEWYLPRPSLRGGVVEAAAVTGLFFAFP